MKWIKLILGHEFRYLHYIQGYNIFSSFFCVSFIRSLLYSIFQFWIQISIEYSKVFLKYLFFSSMCQCIDIEGVFRELLTTQQQDGSTKCRKKNFLHFCFCRPFFCWLIWNAYAELYGYLFRVFSLWKVIFFSRTGEVFFLSSHNRIVHQLILYNSMRMCTYHTTISMLT